MSEIMSMRIWVKACAALIFAASLFTVPPAKAENWTLYKHWNYAKVAFVHDLPFAEKKVVLQVSQGVPARWNLVLNNITNLLAYWGQGKIRIVVVAYGGGLKMLLAKSPLATRIQSLYAEGVEFDACHVTMMKFKRETGHLPELVPQASVVPGGVVRIMQLEEAGFDYVKP